MAGIGNNERVRWGGMGRHAGFVTSSHTDLYSIG